MKKYILIALMSLLLVPAIVKAQIVITITSPNITYPYTDTLSVSARVASNNPLDTVRATVSGRSVLMTYDRNEYSYNGILVLSGLPQGQLHLSVYARDNTGSAQTQSVTFLHHSLPTITIAAPALNATYQSKLHVKVSVKAIGQTNCKGVVMVGGIPGVPDLSDPSYELDFVNNIDTLIDPFPGTFSSYPLSILAIDTFGRMNYVNVPVNFDRSPNLTPVYTATGLILDVADNRVFTSTIDSNYLQVIKIEDIVDKSVQIIPLDKTRLNKNTVIAGKLSTSGAVIGINYSGSNTPDSTSLYAYQNGTLTDINKPLNVSPAGYLVVKGDDLIWMGGYTGTSLYYTNLATMTTTLVNNSNVINNGADVTNGIIAFSLGAPSYNVFKYNINTATTTQVTNRTGGTLLNVSPITDGKNIMYQRGNFQTNIDSIRLFDGANDYNLGSTATFSTRTKYQLADGYAAYSVYDNNHVLQTMLRRPNRTISQISTDTRFGGGLDLLGSTGSMLLRNGNDNLRYYRDSLTAPKVVSGVLGTSFYINNSFSLALGNTLFKYNDLSSPPVLPVISSFTPATATSGDTVKIRGSHFTGTTVVSFGGVNAASYSVSGDTTINAVVGKGATGSVSVTGYSTTGSLAGFTYIAPPDITSFTPLVSATGDTITINGSSFANTSAVSFGATPAASFQLVSPTQIKAVVGSGSSGAIVVTTPAGTVYSSYNSTYGGPDYVFVPTPTIIVPLSTPVLTKGETIVFTASTGDGYTYTWKLNGAVIDGATRYYYAASQPGSYTVSLTVQSVTTTSPAVQLSELFDLPANNFTITVTSASCKGTKNGTINIAAADNTLNYTAEVAGNGIDSVYHFTNSVTSNNLGAGTYSVCITVDGQADYKQCFSAVVDEPQDLSVYTSVNEPDKTVTLSLAGADVYNVQLNGGHYTTTGSSITLSLNHGDNVLSVSTDKECQGIIVKHIGVGNDITLYPNPIDNVLNITVGKDASKVATIQVRDLAGKVVFSQKCAIQYGVFQVDLSALNPGTHLLELGLDNSNSVFKIIKK